MKKNEEILKNKADDIEIVEKQFGFIIVMAPKKMNFDVNDPESNINLDLFKTLTYLPVITNSRDDLHNIMKDYQNNYDILSIQSYSMIKEQLETLEKLGEESDIMLSDD